MLELSLFEDTDDQPPVRVMALHALAYCQRLFYLEEVEEIRLADDRVFAGRRLHAELAEDESGEEVQIELTSAKIGLTGKVDCVKRRDGSYLPYEHKRGKPAKSLQGGPEPWPSDRLQIIAYAVLLEEAFGQPIPEGRVRYHAANVTVRVPIDDWARDDLEVAIKLARRLRNESERPPITDNPRLCASCSLSPVCLPEEVRHERDPEQAAVRLFPQDRDGATLHVVSEGAQVGISADRLTIRPREGPETKHSIRGIETVLLNGFSQITTQAIRKCVEHGVGVHWPTKSGWHTASLTAATGQVQRRIRQYKALTVEAVCLRLAKQLASAKVESQYRYLMRATRDDESLRAKTQLVLNTMKPMLGELPTAADRDALRGGAVALSPKKH
jgi:CRISPR-associated protein Cas1